MAAPRFILDDFWPSDLFLGGIPGAWYDPTDVNVNWRVNLLTYSEQFENAAWVKFNNGTGALPVVTPNAAVAPDGTTTADLIVFDRGVGNTIADMSAIFQTLTVVNGTYTQTVWLKAATAGDVGKQLALRNVQGSTYSAVTLTADWVRYSLVQTGSTGQVDIANRGTITTGNSVSALVWGAQLQTGSTATTYQQIVTPEITYAATQTTNLFQDSTGTTPVWAVEQPVGLILDKSQGLTLGAELVTSYYAGGAYGNWNTLTLSGTTLTSVGGTLNGYTARFNVTAGKTYRVQFPAVLVPSAGTWDIVVSWSANGTTYSGSVTGVLINTTSFVFVPPATAVSAEVTIRRTVASGVGATDTIGPFTGFSVRELAGNHAYQSTAASRPTYRARYNLLTDSENFGPPWSVDNATVTTDTTIAPDGTLTADTLTPSGSLTAFANRVYRVPANLISGATYVVSVWAKSSVANAKMTLSIFNYGGQVFTLTSSWQRYSVSIVAGGTSPNTNIYAGEVNPTTGAIISTNVIQIWGAQLMTAADAAATGNAYQRIAAATVYDTAPIFRPYLAFDGVDDSLSTAAINFTSTDKMTVFAGETKLQDATLGVLAELSTDAPGTNGTFWLLAPYTATERYSALSRGTSFTLANSNSALDVSPNTSVLTARLDISAPLTQLSVNRAVRATNTASQGTGNYGNWPLFIGRRNNSTFPFNGRLYSLIVRGAASSTTEIADTELWVNARTGAF